MFEKVRIRLKEKERATIDEKVFTEGIKVRFN